MDSIRARTIMVLAVMALFLVPAGISLAGRDVPEERDPGVPAPDDPGGAETIPATRPAPRAGSRATVYRYSDWIISSGENEVVSDELIIKGSIEVQPGGSLELDGGTIKFDCSADGEYKLEVAGGAAFETGGTCLVTSNTTFNIKVELGGSTQGAELDVSGCTFQNLWEQGVFIRNAEDMRFRDCAFTDSAQSCMRVESSSGAFTDCTFDQGQYGAYVKDCSPTFTNCSLSDNLVNGLKVNGSSSPTLSKCNVSNNGDPGSIYIEGGISLIDTQKPLIKDTTFYGNAYGIYSRNSQPTIRGCAIRNCAKDGVYIKETSKTAVVEDNVIRKIDGEGLKVISAGITAVGNTFAYCTLPEDDETDARGFYASDTSYLEVRNNTFDNCDLGVHIDNVVGGTIDNNDLTWNDFGAYVSESSDIVFTGNTIADSTEGGIFLNDGSSARLEDNVFQRNDDGMSLTGSTAVLVNGSMSGTQKKDMKMYGTSTLTVKGTVFPGIGSRDLIYFHNKPEESATHAAQSLITVGYYVGRNMSYENGDPAQSAKVTFTPRGGGELNPIKVNGGDDGRIPLTLIPVKEFRMDPGDDVTYTPYAVRAQKGSLVEVEDLNTLDANSVKDIVFYNTAPTVPAPLEPYEGAWVESVDVTFKWDESKDTYPGDDVDHYVLQVSGSGNFSDDDVATYDTNGLSYEVAGLEDETWYSWRVSAVDTFDIRSNFTRPIRFKVDTSNKAPTISPITDIQVRNSVEYRYNLTLHLEDDGDESKLNVTIEQGPDSIYLDGHWLVINHTSATGTETLTVVINVSDGSKSTSATIRVVVSDNAPPAFRPEYSELPAIRMEEDTLTYEVFLDGDWTNASLRLTDYLYDPDLAKLASYTQRVDPEGNRITLALDADGLITVTSIQQDFFGAIDVTIRVMDSASATIDVQLSVTVLPVDDPPRVKTDPTTGDPITIPNRQVNEGKTWSVDLYTIFEDVEGDTLYFECNKDEIEIDSDGKAYWETESGDGGLKGVVFRAGTSPTQMEAESEPIDLEVVSEGMPWWQIIILLVIVAAVVGGGAAAYVKYKQKYQIHHIFLIDNNGILLFHKGMGEKDEMDQDVLSGMLSAVRSFVKDSFGSFSVETSASAKKKAKEELGTLAYGDLQICLDYGDLTYLACVISGFDAPALREKMTTAVERVEKKYAKILKDFDGNVDKLKGINVIMRDLFAQDLAAGGGSRGGAPPEKLPSSKKKALPPGRKKATRKK